MYTELQYEQHRYLVWLKWICAAVTLWQLAALAAVEAGIPWWSVHQPLRSLVLVLAVVLWLLITNSHMRLQVSAKGLRLRYFPFQLFYRHIAWEEIKQLRLIQEPELPSNAQFGFPWKDFTRSYWLTHPRHKVLRIDLTTGAQVFATTQQPAELIDYLQKGVFLSV